MTLCFMFLQFSNLPKYNFNQSLYLSMDFHFFQKATCLEVLRTWNSQKQDCKKYFRLSYKTQHI